MKKNFLILVIFLFGIFIFSSCISSKNMTTSRSSFDISKNRKEIPFWLERFFQQQQVFNKQFESLLNDYSFAPETALGLVKVYRRNKLGYNIAGKSAIYESNKEAKSKIAKTNNFKKFFGFLTPKKDLYPFYEKVKK